MSDRYVCIHGHFYQPPRENPWLEAIELQDSAYPYHDWNERITAECYAPNASARILDDQGRIARIVSNYARISFNVGPTLLAWLESRAPDVYAAILDADVESMRRFGGHGSALAQAYGHMILPLANARDLHTQVAWGLADFEHRFGRAAEGMWLPETAVNLETLDALAAQGVRFTILAPHQAARVRKKRGRTWTDVSGGRIDPTMPYEVLLPSGRSIAVFFYDGSVSQQVAFEGLLRRGEDFADRLIGLFSDEAEHQQLANIATDGETYGHHHRHGDLALGYALEHIESTDGVRLTNYGEHLERCPPTHVVEIIEDTSWSCAHGVERWRSDCGCNTGRGWHQGWREPLRNVLDWLRDKVAVEYEDAAGELLADPWAARNDYIELVLDRSPHHVSDWLDRHGPAEGRPMTADDKIRALELLELQRHMMLAHTSCGWFFDELSGIETVQVLQYAGRVLQLAGTLFGDDHEGEFLDRLAKAPSNLPEIGDGRQVYERMVRPAMVDLTKLAVHYGASSLFEDYPDTGDVYCYEVERLEYRAMETGRARVAIGWVRLTSKITRSSGSVTFGVLHLGDHNLTAGARPLRGIDAYQEMERDITEPFDRADFPEVIRRIDAHFGSTPYSLRTLFRDEQRKVIGLILDHTLAEAHEAYRRLYDDHAPLMRFLDDMQVPLPKAFRATAELVMNTQLLEAFSDEHIDQTAVRDHFRETATWGLELEVDGLSFALAGTIQRVAERLRSDPHSLELLDHLDGLIDLAQSLPWKVDLWRTQQAFYDVVHRVYTPLAEQAATGDPVAAELLGRIDPLAARLAVATPTTV